MSNLNLEEQEQLATVKGWWHDNGTRVLEGRHVYLVRRRAAQALLTHADLSQK